MTELTPYALQDAPALIEAVFPAQKVSFEAQKERKANLGQTLTGLGSYWKGRKPLILVRAIVLGSLLPQTDDAEKDLEIFERLMAFDNEGLARRALIQNALKPKDIALRIELHNPWDYFTHNIKDDNSAFNEVTALTFPLNTDTQGINVRWRRDIDESDKIKLISQAIATYTTYEEKATLCKRPEELDPEWLYAPIWTSINRYYASFGIHAHSHEELTEQLGMLRYGHRPRLGDTFCGGGSIPFEAARLGCDVNASDLNPIACMLSWGALELLSSGEEEQNRIKCLYESVCSKVNDEILEFGIECDEEGNRAKSFLYCLEIKCPETEWIIPLAPSWVISKTHNVIARLTPNYEIKTFDIDIFSGVSAKEMKAAEIGTVRNGAMVYELNGKTYSTPIKTLRGDYKLEDGSTESQLRKWDKLDFHPRCDDIFQERLYAIQWYSASTLGTNRPEAFFKTVSDEDLKREAKTRDIVSENISSWQSKGLLPDMEIEAGYNTSQPIRERGWKHWHQLFNSRQLLTFAIAHKHILESKEPSLLLGFCSSLNKSTKLSRWDSANRGREGVKDVFSNQALNTLYNYGARGFLALKGFMFFTPSYVDVFGKGKVSNHPAELVSEANDLWVTDPPYADAVNYHEITEFFIAWLRKNPPKPFDEWTWDSRRALAIKGSGDDFRKGMVGTYKAMADHMPDNGMQCVMFTHQDTGVWSDMIGIFWAAGLQVVAAWYIATETSTELKKGGYVQGTVILMLRKRPAGENAGFKQRLLPAVRAEVKNQIETMLHLNDEVKDKMGEPVFNDSDLQMAGYAAALKVLTAYTHIGGEDVTAFALRPRANGEVTVVDEIVQQAAEAANSLLVPDGLNAETWHKLSGIQRFYLRMMDIETTGASKLDNYQNFAKAFRVEDYARVMGSMAANKAHLKQITKFESRDLTESTELGASWLGHLIIGLQQLIAETEPQVVISQLQADLPDFMETRPLLIDMLLFIERKAPDETARDAAEVLNARLRNMRALGQ